MSLPTVISDRDALRQALRSSLSDVILDLGLEGRSPRQQHPFAPAANTSPSIALPRADLAPVNVSKGAFDAPFLPSRQVSVVAQSLGLSIPNHAAPVGISADGILLAAAAASERSKLLEQVKASLIQQQVAEEQKRLLLQKSYLDLIQKGGTINFLSKSGAAFFGQQQVAPQVPLQVQPQQALAASRIPADKAFEEIGKNLRSKTDPYIDVSDMADPDPEDSVLRRTRGGVSEPFPEKLHRMLAEVDKKGQSEIVSFFSHGRAFGVHDMDRFVSEIMPQYFKQSKWNSFSRQLNLYGFIRITSGPDAGGYYHELFLKGRPNLCLHMRRVGVPKGDDRRKFRPKNKNVEPDFYSMKRITSS